MKMKSWHLIVLVVLQSLAAGCVHAANKPETGERLTIVVKPQKTSVRLNEPFDIALEVANSSGSEQSFRVMDCSWYQHWKASNSDISWTGWSCRRNVPVTITLKPGEVYEKTLSMSVLFSSESRQKSFQMSFTPIDSKEAYWSNSATIQVV